MEGRKIYSRPELRKLVDSLFDQGISIARVTTLLSEKFGFHITYPTVKAYYENFFLKNRKKDEQKVDSVIIGKERTDSEIDETYYNNLLELKGILKQEVDRLSMIPNKRPGELVALNQFTKTLFEIEKEIQKYIQDRENFIDQLFMRFVVIVISILENLDIEKSKKKDILENELKPKLMELRDELL